MLNFGGFLSHLDGLTDSPQTIKTLKSGFRRLTRDLDDDDVRDAVMVRQYRDSLKQGTRNVFDNVWRHLRAYEGPETALASPDRLPYFKYAHPLFSDLSFLHGYYGDDVNAKTWRDVEDDFQRDDVKRHAMRAFEFITGSREIEPGDPLIPKDRNRLEMYPWQIRYIVNSEQEAGDFDAGMLLREFVCAVSRTDLPASFLRLGADRIVGARTSLSPSQLAKVRRDIRAAFEQGKLEVAHWLIEQIPPSANPELTATEIMW